VRGRFDEEGGETETALCSKKLSMKEGANREGEEKAISETPKKRGEMLLKSHRWGR